MGDDNSRLVYSTGGDAAPERERPKAQAAGATTRGGVRLRLDRRASGRLMTLVSGLALAPGPLARFARELKAACGAGGSVKDGVIELQGDQRDKVEALLEARGVASKRAGG